MTYTGEIHDYEPQGRGHMHRSYEAAKAGISFGSALAIAISWSEHHSIIWAIIHGFLSWLYVAWYAVMR
ncbi:MAG TPA: hypothetical protein VIC03_04135 [Gemmatimonadaceae bacterium]|jgi:hypothetical protein